MADIYYKIDGNDIYYTNENKSGYTLGQTQITEYSTTGDDGSPVKVPIIPDNMLTNGKNVIIELYNNSFILPQNSAGLFYGATNTLFNDTLKWNTSECHIFDAMFSECQNLTTVDMSNFSGESGTYFIGMFKNCTSLIEANLRGLVSNGSNVLESLTEMFYGCTNVVTLDFSGVDIQYTDETELHRMFMNCTKLSTIYVTKDETYEDVTGIWYYNFGNDNAGSTDMFLNCYSLPGYNSNYVRRSSASGLNNLSIPQYFVGYPSGVPQTVYIKQDGVGKVAELYY